MKKNYIILTVLIVVTCILTLLLANLYKYEKVETSYIYENLNKITSEEFDEYIVEHPDTIIYISDKYNLENQKFEKKLINKCENLNILENIIYIDKEEVTSNLEKTLKNEYSYKYNEDNLPAIIVINDAKITQTVIVDKNSEVETIIDYEVFEW